ncbi:hypothetical protein [Streptomyces sp. NPDC086777]|uniref:hypothetical protein n=1 Tax=Streptomyces sp. NPDC086777 TaxID=3154866 RepID=UPI00344BD43E
MPELSSDTLDPVDVRLLGALAADGRAPSGRIADALAGRPDTARTLVRVRAAGGLSGSSPRP